MTVLSSTKLIPQTIATLRQRFLPFMGTRWIGRNTAQPDNVVMTEVSLRRLIADTHHCPCGNGRCEHCDHLYWDINPL